MQWSLLKDILRKDTPLETAQILPWKQVQLVHVMLSFHKGHLSNQDNLFDRRVSLVEADYSGPCILRPLLHPDKYGLKLEMVLKWWDIYTEKNKNGVTDSWS